jgi:hypothetical protein
MKSIYIHESASYSRDVRCREILNEKALAAVGMKTGKIQRSGK